MATNPDQPATVSVDVKGFGRVNFPATFTPEQIQQAIERDVLPKAKAAPEQAEVMPEKPGAWVRAGRGAQDVVDRLTQLSINAGEKMGMVAPGIGDIATQAMQGEREAFDQAKAKTMPDEFDLAGLVGNAGMQAPLALLPGGQKTLISRIFAGALQGGASGGMQFDPTNSAKGTAKNVGVGAAVGAVAAPVVGYVGDKAGEAAKWIAGRVKGLGAKFSGEASEAAILKAVPELQAMTPEERIPLIEEAKKQIAKMGTLDDAAMSRKANLVANEITPTKSMVTRDPADWTLERNLQKLAQSPDEQLSGVGRDLTKVYGDNDAAMTKQLTKLGENIPKATQEGYGMTVMQSIDDLADASQKEVGKIYEQIKAAKGADLASDAKTLRGTLDDLKDSAYAEKLVTSVTNRLKRFGMLDKDGNLTAETLTVSQSEELRKFVNTLPNDFGKRDIIKAIDADVFEGAGEDAFKAARNAAAHRFGMLDNPATQRAMNAYGELTQGKTAQNFIKTQVIDAPAQDVKTLVATLGKIGDDAKKKEALNAMKGGVLSYLREEAINTKSGKFSGASLVDAIDKVGEEKLVLTLGKTEADKLKSLARAALDATYEPAYSAVQHSNTAPMLMSLMQKARTIPGVPLLVTDEAQKIAARSGYQNQLADALAAQSGQLPQVPQSVASLVEALRLAAPPAAATAINQQRKPADKKAKDRK